MSNETLLERGCNHHRCVRYVRRLGSVRHQSSCYEKSVNDFCRVASAHSLGQIVIIVAKIGVTVVIFQHFTAHFQRVPNLNPKREKVAILGASEVSLREV